MVIKDLDDLHNGTEGNIVLRPVPALHIISMNVRE